MKKIHLFIFVLLISLSLSLCAFATKESGPVAKDEKDGISAELYLIPVNENEISASVSIALAQDAANISNVSVELTIADAFILESGEAPAKLSLAPGESKMLYYTLMSHDAAQTVGSTPVTDEVDDNGCGAVVSSAAVLFALIISVFFVLKNPKRGAAFTFALLMIFPLVFSASAVTTERKIMLEGMIELDGVEHPVTAMITYDHSFTEQKAEGTDGMDKFEITYYWGPQGQDLCNEEYIKKIAECGFTSVPIESWDPAVNKVALGYFRKYGMTCSALSDYRIQNALAISDQTTIDNLIGEVVAEYKDYDDVIKGWLLRDEPSAADFPALGRVVDAFRRIDPDRTTMINLFPTYAKPEQLGTQGYQEHLDKFISVVDPHYLSYDHYHFQKNTTRKGFFENMEIFRDTALENELDYMLIILLTEHMTYADLTKYQIEWEVNMCLAYGMKRISYFTYWLSQDLLDQGWSDACMDTTGKVYPHYYDVQEINKWLLPLGTELFDKTSTAVFHTRSKGGGSLEKGCELYKSYGDLGEVEADASVVIGFFDDGSFMITNKMYTDTEAARNVVRFLDVASGLEYFDTESATWKDAETAGVAVRNENGILCHTFEPGEGMLFRVKGK